MQTRQLGHKRQPFVPSTRIRKLYTRGHTRLHVGALADAEPLSLESAGKFLLGGAGDDPRGLQPSTPVLPPTPPRRARPR